MKYLKPLAVLIAIIWATPVYACEPIIPLAQLFSGTLFGARSLAMLWGAILIKTLAFIVFEKRIPWYKAICFMVAANVVSSLIGLGLAISAALPIMLPEILIFVYVISLPPAKRLLKYNPGNYLHRLSRLSLAGIFTGLFLTTWVLFFVAREIVSGNVSLVIYWILKFLYVYSALVVSIGLTTIWEEWIIAGLSAPALKDAYFHLSVLKANLLTFLVVFVYAAIMMLPGRLQSVDFLVRLTGGH